MTTHRALAETTQRKKDAAERAMYRIINKITNRQQYQSPLEFLCDAYNNTEVEMDLRIKAAIKAADYMHNKMPNSVEVSGPDRGEIQYSLVAHDAHKALENMLIDAITLDGE